jgi:hypothetical protein
MKPSIKNKLSADRIEEANRLLNETKPTAEVTNPVISAPKVLEIVENLPNTEGGGAAVVVPKPKATAKSVDKKTIMQTVEKPSRRSKIAILAEEENLRLVRVTIDIPEDLHEKMKIKMILTKQTMKDYLLDFIRKDVGNANFGYK